MAQTFNEPQPLNYIPEYIPPNEISQCDQVLNDDLDPPNCDSCPGPRVAYEWLSSGDYGLPSGTDTADGVHSIWIGGIRQWYWSTGLED
jgi:hypothetical protein